MGCADSHEQGAGGMADASIGPIPEVFVGSWESDQCCFRFTSSGIEWRGAGEDSKQLSVFTMDWNTQPVNDAIAPLPQTWGEGNEPWVTHGLVLPMPSREMLVFKTSRPCESMSGGQDVQSFWWLRPHTEYTEHDGKWTVLETLTGAMRCSSTKEQRFVRTDGNSSVLPSSPPVYQAALNAPKKTAVVVPQLALSNKSADLQAAVKPSPRWTPRAVPMALRTPRDALGTPRDAAYFVQTPRGENHPQVLRTPRGDIPIAASALRTPQGDDRGTQPCRPNTTK